MWCCLWFSFRRYVVLFYFIGLKFLVWRGGDSFVFIGGGVQVLEENVSQEILFLIFLENKFVVCGFCRVLDRKVVRILKDWVGVRVEMSYGIYIGRWRMEGSGWDVQVVKFRVSRVEIFRVSFELRRQDVFIRGGCWKLRFCRWE